jgi:predicted transcriptional regulator
MCLKSIIIANLKKYRQACNLSTSDVAKLIPMKPGTYRKYEEGRAEPNIATLLRLKEIFGLRSVDELLTNTPADKKESIAEKYYSLPPDKRQIVDFVMGLK